VYQTGAKSNNLWLSYSGLEILKFGIVLHLGVHIRLISVQPVIWKQCKI